MRSIIKYVKEEKYSFSKKAFNPVDSLVLSQFAYLELDGLVPTLGECSDWVTIKSVAAKKNQDALYAHTRTWPSKKLLWALENSPRFRHVKINYYANKIDYDIEKQFSAVTFRLSNGETYIAYRGTDFSFVGWKEDFNMTFSNSVPSQEEGVNYLNQVGKIFSGKLQMGGHSKGGNLATYAVMKCDHEVRDRVTDIYSHDAPGFREEVFRSSDYEQIKGKIHQYIPQSSLVGMLLKHSEDYVVVKSKSLGVMQHDPFSWIVEDGDFKYLETVSNRAIFTSRTIKLWLDSITDDDRELFVNTLYDVIAATGAKTFSDLTEDMREKAVAVSETIENIDEETKNFLVETVRELISIAVENLKI